MSVSWTDEQNNVIELRNRNLLVSAAAGSGKTAVLVERIISMITDKLNPIDIDTLLIVTFTNAAATEMKERIGAAIDKKVEEFSNNTHLQKQQTLIHTADITTIDSFCLKILRENFDTIDLDPAFRIGDEGEMKLLRTDVVKAVLEEYYQEGSAEFHHFIESYTTGKTDDDLEDLILSLYQFAVSYPDPQEWLERCLEVYQTSAKEECFQSSAFLILQSYLEKMAQDILKRLQLAKQVCQRSDGPYMYLSAIESDLFYISSLVGQKDYEAFGKALFDVDFMRLPVKKDNHVSDEKRELVKSLRESVKADIKDIKKLFYFQSSDEMYADIHAVKDSIMVLVKLTLSFQEYFSAVKKEKNILDFLDIEHFALQVLTTKDENGEWKPTAIADEYSRHYVEVMIDEYQDSNYVQDLLLSSVSKIRNGKPNMFMVGDVKQSIYKFRLARPELFMQKYDEYSSADSLYQKIDLHKNFRSRSEVLSSINDIFFRIMHKSLGDITYNQDTALHVGLTYPPNEDTGVENNGTEMILIEREAESAADLKLKWNPMELEAKVIAKRIKQLIHKEGLMVFDKENKVYRNAAYRDIVILLRSVAGFGDTMVSVLMEEGIPAYSQSQTGYFTALEVQTLLNLLRIIDNPRQDIPLTGVLRSPIAGLTTEELAWMRANHQDGSMYDAMSALVNSADRNHPAYQKISVFFDKLTALRNIVPYMAIPDLLRTALSLTEYGDYVSAMPAGEKRRMNLDMMIEKASMYEKTSYRGLFHFIRYIEKLQKYDIDFGEAALIGEQDNIVRIMSIHKSKGLEFPIVFVSGLGRRINQMDAAQKVILHADMGIGVDYVDHEKRLKSPTLLKRIMQKKIRLENLGEELRILYVALTRAKEKLILTGTVANLEKRLSVWNTQREEGSFLTESESYLRYGIRAGATVYFDWIIPAYNSETLTIITSNPLEVFEKEKDRQKQDSIFHEEIKNFDGSKIVNADMKSLIEDRFSYRYLYEQELGLYSKATVSEIKKKSQLLELEEEGDSYMLITINEPMIPKFMQKEEELTAGKTARGTAYHSFLEHLVFPKKDNLASIQEQKNALVSLGKLTPAEADSIENMRILTFLRSATAGRMREALERNALFKEQQFTVGLPAKELYPDSESNELIILQGVIDVYFEEYGALVLVDYKTDFVRKGEEDVLRKRYHTQFQLYKKSLEQMTGKPVAEMILYSFFLGKELLITDEI